MSSHLDVGLDAVAVCCGSRRWRELMAVVLPVSSPAELLTGSARAFDALGREDWLEAFAAHAAIGARPQGSGVDVVEQSGVRADDRALLAALEEGNRTYLGRFGFVFLIRARGRSGADMLAALDQRLGRTPEEEFAVACAAQREITALRLSAIVAPDHAPAGRRDPPPSAA